MKKFLAILIVGSLLLTVGCGNGEETSVTTPTGEVEIEPTLYTVGDAMDRVYMAAGCVGDDTDADTITVYLASYGTTPTDLLTELETSPSTSITLARLFKDSGISMSEVDWSTVNDIYDFAGFSSKSPVVDTNIDLTLTADRDEFVDIITHYGVADYWNKLNQTYGTDNISVDRPDETLVSDLLNNLSIQDVLSKYPSTCKIINDNTIEMKVNAGSKSYYELARRNGYKYVSFYPYNDDGSGALYMRNTYGESPVPLWEVYFCAYMSYLQTSMNVTATNGVVNNTTDGIEIWWSPSTGYTVSLYVYESGLIRLTYGTDDRYTEYIDDMTTVDGDKALTVKAAVKDKISGEFSMSDSSFETFITLAQVFNLPCASGDLNGSSEELSQEEMQEWLDAAAIFNSYLKAVDKAYQTDITAYEFSTHLVDFASIGRTNAEVSTLRGCLDLISSEASNTSPMSGNHDTTIDLYREFTDAVLNTVGSKSYFMLENYNAFLTNISYTFSGTDKSDEIATQFTDIKSNPVLFSTMKAVFDDYSGGDISLAESGMYSSIKQNRMLDILSCVSSNQLYSTSTVADIQSTLFSWFTYGRSDVTAENIASVDISSLTDYNIFTIEELKRSTDAQNALSSVLDSAIKYTDMGAYVSGKTIVQAITSSM